MQANIDGKIEELGGLSPPIYATTSLVSAAFYAAQATLHTC